MFFYEKDFKKHFQLNFNQAAIVAKYKYCKKQNKKIFKSCFYYSDYLII